MSNPLSALKAATSVVTSTRVQPNSDALLKTAIVKLRESSVTERSEMQRLNKELRGYLESVQMLENLNRKLLDEVAQARLKYMPTTQDTSAFDSEIEMARRRLEEEALKVARYNASIEKNEDDTREMNARLRFFQNELEIQQQIMRQLSTQLSEFDNQKESLRRSAVNAENEIRRDKERIEKSEVELKNLSASLKESRSANKQIEFEILSLQDELLFRKALFDEERSDLKTRYNGSNVISTVDLNTFYKNELANSVTQIRQDFHTLNEQQLRDLKERKEQEYQLIMQQAEYEKALEVELKSKRDASASLELKSTSELRAEMDMEKKEINELKAYHQQLFSRLTQLETALNDTVVRNRNELDIKTDEAERLKEDNMNMANELEYWDRVTRTKLESEIQTYRSILNSQLKFLQNSSSMAFHSSRPQNHGGSSAANTVISSVTSTHGGSSSSGSGAANTVISGVYGSGGYGSAGGDSSYTKTTTVTVRSKSESFDILRQIFNTFDANRNGTINSSEFDRILQALNVQLTQEGYNQLMREMDRDGNREVSFDEFCRIMSPVLTGKFDDDDLYYAFKKFDLDNSGEITVQELSQILSKIGQYYSDKQIADMVRSVDRNADGKLSYDEFARLMKNSL